MKKPSVTVGQRFGKLIAVEPLCGTPAGINWRWVCDCGKTIERAGTQVKAANNPSCGCSRRGGKGVQRLVHYHTSACQLHDESRRLPRDEKGRRRYIGKDGRILVSCGIHHPLSNGNGYVAEPRLRAFEAGLDITGKFVTEINGEVRLFSSQSELMLALRPKRKRFCKCGCGTEIEVEKYLPGHRKTVNGAFAHLPVSRERKRQLRKASQGLCVRGACKNQRLKGKEFCLPCMIAERVRRQLRFGYKRKTNRCMSEMFKLMETNKNHVAWKITQKAMERGWTLGDFCRECGMSQVRFTKISFGDMPLKRMEVLALCQLFKTEENYWETK